MKALFLDGHEFPEQNEKNQPYLPERILVFWRLRASKLLTIFLIFKSDLTEACLAIC